MKTPRGFSAWPLLRCSPFCSRFDVLTEPSQGSILVEPISSHSFVDVTGVTSFPARWCASAAGGVLQPVCFMQRNQPSCLRTQQGRVIQTLLIGFAFEWYKCKGFPNIRVLLNVACSHEVRRVFLSQVKTSLQSGTIFELC